MPEWIDTHCHLDAPEFSADRAAVRAAARAVGVVHCVIPAVARHTWDAACSLAHAAGDSYALGIHPLYTPQADDADLDALADALRRHHADPRLVAVGEIGLDGFVPGLDMARQERFLRAQLRLARDHGLPVILHVRRAVDRVLRHLRELAPADGWRGIAHAFNGSVEQALACRQLGLVLGFGGATTFDRALQLRRLAAHQPADALVLETDAPDIPPHWLYRDAAARASGAPQGRNAPDQLPRIAAEIAALRGLDLATLAQQMRQTTCAALPRVLPLLPVPENVHKSAVATPHGADTAPPGAAAAVHPPKNASLNPP